MVSSSSRRILLSLVLVFSLVLVSGTGIFLANQQSGGNRTMTQSSNPDWADVERLVSADQFNDALTVVDTLLEQARSKKDTANWTKALVRSVQLRMGLHGYETAVRFLREQPWPEDRVSRTVLGLYYAQALQTYYTGYSWEISQRETVGSELPPDLKAWTRDQIFSEMRRIHEELWRDRAQLGTEPISSLSEYIQPNDYPAGIRDRLRDALSYLYVTLLANTSFWKPQEENSLYQLNLADLTADPNAAATPDPVSGQQSAVSTFPHPVIRIADVLKELERWHAAAGRREARLEARLERLRRLHAAFSQEEDRREIKSALEQVLSRNTDVPWWSMGQSLLAEIVREETDPGRLVRARQIAERGYQAYPKSIGGQRCLHLVKSIEAPEFHLAAMASDAAGKRSVQVTHRNAPRLHFRAYPVDLANRLASARDYNLLLNSEEQWNLIRSGKPEAEWVLDLPATPDFELHRTFVTPPLSRPGYYAIVASTAKGFTKQLNQIESVNFILTDLVLLTRHRYNARDFEVQVLAGKTGEPIVGAEVDVYRYDYQQGHRRVNTIRTGPAGAARFELSRQPASRYGYDAYFLLARHAGHVVLNHDSIVLDPYERPQLDSRCLVYTDRSVYRPNQKLLWKILAFSQGDQERFAPATRSQVKVSLVDANNQEVEAGTVTTNEFGTASGEFLIPSGRMLGRWYVRTSFGNGAGMVRVEEYKRPTFEASLKDPESPLRLNRPAVVKGEARYYFGLPVTNGSISWRVTREPVYPWWWGWYGWGGSGGGTQTLAVGTSVLKQDGSFEVAFSPQADERDAKKSREISYRYKITADVTDEGGETQTAERAFRVGFVSVEATISPKREFFREASPVSLSVSRTNLDGVPRPGKGSWRLVSLQQPEKALPPADLPVARPRTESKDADLEFRTPGDRLRPRWQPDYSAEREMHSWADGAEKGHGDVTHDAKGQAAVQFDRLEPGPYRLHYKTTDDFGVPYETFSEFVVAGGNTRVALPALFVAEDTSCKVGESAAFLALSALPNQPIFFEIYKAGQLQQRRQLISGRDRPLIEVPVTEADRGGFAVRLVTVIDHQLISWESSVFVPWDNKELKVEFSTFRDKLRPGEQETWKISVKSPAGKEVGIKAAEVLAYMYDR
ncbi:MAG: hypothetical protein EHM61_27105, partial [Acidobacteria bacterium]